MVVWIVSGVFVIFLGTYVYHIGKTLLEDFEKITSHGEW